MKKDGGKKGQAPRRSRGKPDRADTPHNNFFVEVFDKTEHAVALLKKILPKGLFGAFNWESAKMATPTKRRKSAWYN